MKTGQKYRFNNIVACLYKEKDLRFLWREKVNMDS